MKKMKKVLAMILSLVMALAMSATAFAAEDGITSTTGTMAGEVPSSGDIATVKITGLEGNPTVTLYQIIEPEYGTGGLKGWKPATGFESVITIPTGGAAWNPTADVVTQIAQSITESTTSIETKPVTNGEYSKEVGAGAYIAIISGASDGYIYNPVILTASYDKDSKILGHAVNTAEAVYAGSAVAKKTHPEIDKSITGGTEPDGDKETASVGDVVKFKLDPTLPSYPAGAKNKLVLVSDTMDQGLRFVEDSIKVTLFNGTTKVVELDKVPNSSGVVEFKNGNDVVAKGNLSPDFGEGKTGFILSFDYDKLLISGPNSATYKPVITYNATITDAAVVAGNGNENNTKLYFTNDPNTEPSYDPKEPVIPTGDDVKNFPAKETVYTYQIAFKKHDSNSEATTLPGAQFGIYPSKADAEAGTNLIETVTTNQGGIAISTQVRKGTYWVKELVAPDGYSLNETPFSVDAQWTTATTTVTTTTTARTYGVIPENDTTKTQVGYLKQQNAEDTNGIFYSTAAIKKMIEAGDVEQADLTRAKGYFPAYIVSETSTTATKDDITENSNVTTGNILSKVPNTKMSELPSTGGIGTTIFTIGGCIIMIVAAGLFFASRRKKAEN